MIIGYWATSPNCEEKMDLIFGFGIIHSGGNHFVAECPKCKTKTDFSDNDLWLKCRCLGLEIWQKTKQVKNENHKRFYNI